MCGDDHSGPIGNHASERVGTTKFEHLVPDDHLPEVDDHREREQRMEDGGVPSTCSAMIMADACFRASISVSISFAA